MERSRGGDGAGSPNVYEMATRQPPNGETRWQRPTAHGAAFGWPPGAQIGGANLALRQPRASLAAAARPIRSRRPGADRRHRAGAAGGRRRVRAWRAVPRPWPYNEKAGQDALAGLRGLGMRLLALAVSA